MRKKIQIEKGVSILGPNLLLHRSHTSVKKNVGNLYAAGALMKRFLEGSAPLKNFSCRNLYSSCLDGDMPSNNHVNNLALLTNLELQLPENRFGL